MRGENTGISWGRIDTADSTDRRSIPYNSATQSNLSIKKRVERKRQMLRAELDREHIESMNRAPTLLQSLVARFFK